MAKQLQHRGGTTTQHSTFTGAAREITVDTTKNTAVVHDGSTAGGIPLATEASVTSLTSTVADKVPQTTTVNGHALSGNVTVTASDVGLGSVENKSSATIRGELTSSNVTTALGFTPYNATNPNGYITGITSANVTGALGFTPYNASNPNGYITGITSSNVTTALGYTPYNAGGATVVTSSNVGSYALTSVPAASSGTYGGVKVSLSGTTLTITV